jgi:DamX protein
MNNVELNNRLDYLISYSSQLVFVCTDKVKQQSQVVESFLGQQNEHTEIALLTANELTPLVSYRETLSNQLVPHTQSMDFNRPLNQLLASLNQHDGPILISISQADKLPERLVKELWELVLQSRFANNKQRLNVLLMGNSKWAEAAKANVGYKSKGQPILINSQMPIVNSPPSESSELDRLVNSSRDKFSKRIQHRNKYFYVSQPIYKKWWVCALLGLTFFGVFAGLLYWQYPQQISSFIVSLSPERANTVIPAMNLTNISLAEPEAIIEAQLQSTAATAVVEKSPDLLIAVQSQPVPDPSTVMAKLELKANHNVQDKLITDWSAAIAKSDQLNSQSLAQANTAQARSIVTPQKISRLTAVQAKQDGNVQLFALGKPIINEQSLLDSKVSNPVILATSKPLAVSNDYQVEDIISFEVVTVDPDIEQPPILKTAPVSNKPIQNNQLRAGLITNQAEMLLALSSDKVVIQIAAMSNLSILKDYIVEQDLTEQHWLYTTKRYGGDWHVLLKNQHFASASIARLAIPSLPQAVRNNQPFSKTIAQVREEILELNQ